MKFYIELVLFFNSIFTLLFIYVFDDKFMGNKKGLSQNKKGKTLYLNIGIIIYYYQIETRFSGAR